MRANIVSVRSNPVPTRKIGDHAGTAHSLDVLARSNRLVTQMVLRW